MNFRGYTLREIWKETHRAVWRNNGAKVTRVFDVDWDQSGAVIQQILGYPAVSGNKIKRVTPMAYSSTALWLRAVEISEARGIGTPDPTTSGAFRPRQTHDPVTFTPRYKYNRLTVEFQTLPYDVVDDVSPDGTDESDLSRYVTIKYKPVGSFLLLPKGLLKYTYPPAGGELARPAVATGTPFFEAKTELQITWEMSPIIPHAVRLQLGCVNTNPFLGYPAGTVLYLSSDITPIISPMGQRLYSITYFFSVFSPPAGVGLLVYPAGAEAGHNHLLQPPGPIGKTPDVPGTGGPTAWNQYTLVTDDGLLTGRRIYQSADFAYLFRPV